ncbi:hypothetical protein BDV93DRAFT_574726 [Ceratobasidium sp. AG-I]|nr:hypothetical protein BDV93DRAFT_574726 [Ceratobasidium sp. AG-I]
MFRPESPAASCGLWPTHGCCPEWWGHEFKADWPLEAEPTAKWRASLALEQDDHSAAASGSSQGPVNVTKWSISRETKTTMHILQTSGFVRLAIEISPGEAAEATIIPISIPTTVWAFESYLIFRQYPNYSRQRPSARYGRAKARFQVVSKLYSQILETGMISLGAFPWVWNAAGSPKGLVLRCSQAHVRVTSQASGGDSCTHFNVN